MQGLPFYRPDGQGSSTDAERTVKGFIEFAVPLLRREDAQHDTAQDKTEPPECWLACYEEDGPEKDKRPYLAKKRNRGGRETNPATKFRFNPATDVLNLPGFPIPKLRPKGGLQASETMPIQRLMITKERTLGGVQYTELWHEANRKELQVKPMLDHLPYLKEFTLCYMRAGYDWFLDWFPWSTGGTPCGSPDTPHTGKTWKVNPIYEIGERQIWATIAPLGKPEALPLMGQVGYTRCGKPWIHGGFYGGFRYVMDTDQLYSTPLSPDELGYAMGGEGALFYDHHPQMISRLWIVQREEQGPEFRDHHNWVNMEDSEVDAMLRVLWTCMRLELAGTMGGERYQSDIEFWEE